MAHFNPAFVIDDLQGGINPEENGNTPKLKQWQNVRQTKVLISDHIYDNNSSSLGGLGGTVKEVDQMSLTQEHNFNIFSLFSLASIKDEQKRKKRSKLLNIGRNILLLLLGIGYVTASILTSPEEEEEYWCSGRGLVIILASLIAFGIFYNKVIKPFLETKQVRRLLRHCKKGYDSFPGKRVIQNSIYIILLGILIAFLVLDTVDDRSRLISAGGVLVILLFGLIFSTAPKKVIFRQVFWGIALQYIFGILILRWSTGKNLFRCLGGKVETYLTFTSNGSTFVFGDLAGKMHIFAFSVLTVVLFFSFCIQILYYYGIMQWIIINVGWFLQCILGTTACESVNAAANIFVSQSEAPLIIKPYISMMTKSELHALMTGGFATVSGSVLSAYISFGIDPSHLLTASVMSAPAALAFAKLSYPEVEESQTRSDNIKIGNSNKSNVLHAAIDGVVEAIPLVANIAANLIAFIAFVAFIDTVFNWSCTMVSVEDGTCTMKNIFGYAFMCLSYVMGVPWEDCYQVGQLLGTKTIINEFVAYIDLENLTQKSMISKRSQIIATYALCGFSNISSIGIQLGGLGSIAPERRGDLAKIALRAMISGSMACFLTACVAGSLISETAVERHYGNATEAL